MWSSSWMSKACLPPFAPSAPLYHPALPTFPSRLPPPSTSDCFLRLPTSTWPPPPLLLSRRRGAPHHERPDACQRHAAGRSLAMGMPQPCLRYILLAAQRAASRFWHECPPRAEQHRLPEEVTCSHTPLPAQPNLLPQPSAPILLPQPSAQTLHLHASRSPRRARSPPYARGVHHASSPWECTDWDNPKRLRSPKDCATLGSPEARQSAFCRQAPQA